MRLLLNIIPEEIIEKYNLRAMEKNGHIYAGIIQLMYGLPQSGKIANGFLTKNIALHGYYPFLTHTRPMETQIDTSNFFFGSGLLWSQICLEATRGTYYHMHPKYYPGSVD